jgi:hypothetical protein
MIAPARSAAEGGARAEADWPSVSLKECKVLKTPAGGDYVGKVWPGDAVFPDFSRVKAREWWGERDRVNFSDPVDYFFEYDDGSLVLHFTLPFDAAFKSKSLSIEIYDPTYFVDFGLERNNARGGMELAILERTQQQVTAVAVHPLLPWRKVQRLGGNNSDHFVFCIVLPEVDEQLA